MYFCWMPAETAMTSVCLCLSSFRTHSQRWSPNTRSRRTLSLSLCFKKDKLWNCGHLASLLLKELHDRQWIILVLKLIDFSQCVGGASNEGRRTPEQGTQRCDHEKQAESGEMLNMIMIARDTCSLAMWLCFLSPS